MEGSEKPLSRKQMEEAVKAMQAQQEILEMGYKETTKMLKSLFDAYIGAGFTEKQAFELILKKGLNPV